MHEFLLRDLHLRLGRRAARARQACNAQQEQSMSLSRRISLPIPNLLRGRAILITGAGGGFGRCARARDAPAPARRVILCGRNGAKLDALYDEIEALGAPQPAIAGWISPLRPPRTTTAWPSTVGPGIRQLDGLVHAAALLGDRTPLEQYDVPTWCRVLHVNLTAPFILTPGAAAATAPLAGCLGHLRQQRRGAQPARRFGAPTRSPRRPRIRARHALAGARERGEHPHQQHQSRAHAHRACAPRRIRRRIRTPCRAPHRSPRRSCIC